MDYKRFARRQIENIKRAVGDGKAISALSGGVDSAVVTVRRLMAARLWAKV